MDAKTPVSAPHCDKCKFIENPNDNDSDARSFFYCTSGELSFIATVNDEEVDRWEAGMTCNCNTCLRLLRICAKKGYMDKNEVDTVLYSETKQ